MAFDSTSDNYDGKIVQKIRNFKVMLMSSSTSDNPEGTTSNAPIFDHSKGLIGYDFPLEHINELLRDHPRAGDIKGIRVVPSTDDTGMVSMFVTPYGAHGNDIYVKITAIPNCCPQPPNTHAGTTLDRLVQSASA